MRLALFLVLVACKGADEEPHLRPVHVGPITARTSSFEQPPADGSPMTPMTIAAYRAQYANSAAVVVAKAFPPDLSSHAGAGINFEAGGKNVTWIFDGDPQRGFWLAYDENANGDLRDDSRHSFHPIPGGYELTLTLTVSDDDHASMAAPMRIRLRDGELYRQLAMVRRGELDMPDGPMKFALVGDRGRFGLDYQFIAFDLDRDGKLDLEAIDGPELFHVFEKAVTLDDKSYALDIEPHGDRLTLRPLDHRLPDRPPLVAGTPAPDFRVTALDGRSVSLSSLRGSIVLVDFWSTACRPCVSALPRLASLRRRLHGRGFELVAIADESDDVQRVLGDQGVGIDAIDESVQAMYRIDRFPSYFLIGRDGRIACAHCTLDRLEQLVETQLR